MNSIIFESQNNDDLGSTTEFYFCPDKKILENILKKSKNGLTIRIEKDIKVNTEVIINKYNNGDTFIEIKNINQQKISLQLIIHASIDCVIEIIYNYMIEHSLFLQKIEENYDKHIIKSILIKDDDKNKQLDETESLKFIKKSLRIDALLCVPVKITSR